VPAGRRSGKTELAKRYLAIMAMVEPKPYSKRYYFAAAPINKQARRIYWNDLKELTKPWWSEKPRESDMIIFVKGAKGRSPAEIHVFGMDKPERIEGTPWDGGILDEYGNMKPQAWGENVRPALSDRQGWCWLIGVPEGRNHYYDLALDACNGALPEAKPGEGAYLINGDFGFFTWHSADILPEAEIIAAKKHLDEKTFRQEYEAAFESYEGLAYWAFGQHNLDMIEYNPQERIAVGMDFNVNPMTAVLGHIRGDEFHQFGEVWLANSNTYEMARYLAEEYPADMIDIYPDSTGAARESNATESDLAILRKAGFRIYAKKTNPYVKDRVNAVNSLMRAADGTSRYKVNPQTCPKTINDLNKAERLMDGSLNKTQEAQGIHHISAALGYLIHYNWPVKRERIETVRRG
jgi:hypothetical protein